MTDQVVIVGAGPGGYSAGVHLAKNGAQVTIVEGHRLGGVCLNYGCIPTKTLITSTKLLDAMRRADEFGLEGGEQLWPNMKKILARKDRVVQSQIKGLAGSLQKQNIDLVEGRAELLPAGKLQITQPDGATFLQPWDKLILAPGSSPLDLPGFTLEQEVIISSDQALKLEEVPERLLIVGGGVIGCEFAFIFKRLGSEVTLVEVQDRLLPLPSVDRDCSKLLQREMKKNKIAIFLQNKLTSWEKIPEGLQVRLSPASWQEDHSGPKKETLTRVVDTVLVCVGRSPNTTGLGLEQAGVQTDQRGWITVNEKMETSVPGIYAVGDVLGPSRIMLAHVAAAEGLVAADNVLGGEKTMDYRLVPGAVFTAPEVACVGWTEEQAREQGVDFGVQTVLMRTQGKAQAMGEIAGQLKMVYDKEKRTILGVHLAGAQASEMVAEATLAMQAGCSLETLARTIHPHPTMSEAMQEAAQKAVQEVKSEE